MKNELLNRFTRYVQIWSTSDSDKADSGRQPSTNCQFDFANVLSDEMNKIGIQNVQVTEHCYIYGNIPATKGFESVEPLCLLAHIDTVEEVSGQNVKPIVRENCKNEKIVLDSGDILDPACDKDLAEAIKNGETIITSDGNTLLGADDKAGVAEIMTAVEEILKKNIPHGKIEIVFSPDEETGHGMDNVPLNLIESKKAYTVDGGHIGELETECFNAYKSEIVFTGKSKHTGSARPDMVNAISMAASFLNNLPKNEAPETTDGMQGFFAPMTVEGTIETAKVCLFLRDFGKTGMTRRKMMVENLAKMTASLFGGKVEVTHTFQYENMKEKLDANPSVVANLVEAYRKAGVEPKFVPIRGGTDGSRLTEIGIPTPNIFTGGHNYHSRTEWASLEQMEKAAEILVNLVSKN
ncbi:MAG: peptidase T [Treponema sp.]|nr:peptidase T [Treponema sp.]